MRLSFKTVIEAFKQVEFWSDRGNLEIGSELCGFPSSVAFGILQASKLFTKSGEMWTPDDDVPLSQQVDFNISYGCLPPHERVMAPTNQTLTDSSRNLPILNKELISGDVAVFFSHQSNKFANDFTLCKVEAGIIMQVTSSLFQFGIIPRNDHFTRSIVFGGPFLGKPSTSFWIRTFDGRNIQLESGEILLLRKIGNKYCVIHNGDASRPWVNINTCFMRDQNSGKVHTGYPYQTMTFSENELNALMEEALIPIVKLLRGYENFVIQHFVNQAMTSRYCDERDFSFLQNAPGLNRCADHLASFARTGTPSGVYANMRILMYGVGRQGLIEPQIEPQGSRVRRRIEDNEEPQGRRVRRRTEENEETTFILRTLTLLASGLRKLSPDVVTQIFSQNSHYRGEPCR